MVVSKKVEEKADAQEVQPKKTQQEPFPKSLLPYGKFEITPDQTFTVTLFLKEFKGRWSLVDSGTRESEKHTVVFRMWNFDECLRMRRECYMFDPTTRTNRLDNDKLNRIKIMKLLQDWTLSKDNPRLDIQRVHGVLTEASWQAFTRISPSIADKIISEMNLVLDYGG
jgi:hypothetical protein